MSICAQAFLLRQLRSVILSVTVNLFVIKLEYWCRRGNNISFLVVAKFFVEGLVLTNWHEGQKSHTYKAFMVGACPWPYRVYDLRCYVHMLCSQKLYKWSFFPHWFCIKKQKQKKSYWELIVARSNHQFW